MLPVKTQIGVKLSDKGLAWLDETAHQHRITRAALVRQALAFAARNQKEFDHQIETSP